MDRRLGKIDVSREALESGCAYEALRRMDIYAVEYHPDMGVYRLLASCDEFEPVPEGTVAPFYTVDIQRYVQFRKVS